MAGIDLFRFVKSLSKSEKRFFTMTTAALEKEKNYVKLFNTLDQMNEYDESTLTHHLKNEKFLKYIAVEKHYLYEVLMKSLRNFNNELSTEMQAKNLLIDVEVLFQKGLYSQCEKRIQSCLKLCRENELLTLHLLALDWLKKVGSATMGNKDFINQNIKISEEKKAVYSALMEVQEYEDIQQAVLNFHFKTGLVRNDKNQLDISDYPCLSREALPKSRRATLLHFSILGIYANIKGDHQLALNAQKGLVDFLESTAQIHFAFDSYVNGIANLILESQSLDRHSDSFYYLKKLKAICETEAGKSDHILQRIFMRIQVYGVQHCTNIGYFELYPQLQEGISLGLNRFSDKLEQLRVIQLYVKLSVHYTCAGKPSLALPWINKVLNSNNTNVNSDGYCLTRVLNLINHYELGNIDTVESLIKSTFRYLSKAERLYGMEKAILTFLKKILSRNFSRNDLDKMLEEFIVTLNEIARDPYEANFLRAFDIIAWVESKVSGKPLSMMIKEKANADIEEEELKSIITSWNL